MGGHPGGATWATCVDPPGSEGPGKMQKKKSKDLAGWMTGNRTSELFFILLMESNHLEADI